MKKAPSRARSYLASLPLELLWIISGYLPSYRDVAPLVRVNRLFFHAFTSRLYQRNRDEARSALETALVWAAVNGRLDTALQAYNVGVTGIPSELVAFASRYGHYDVVRFFFEKACQDKSKPYRETNLHRGLSFALTRGHEPVVTYLVEQGVWLGRQYPLAGATVLHLASQLRYPAMTKLLLEHGAEVEARCVLRRTPLHLASRSAATRESLKHLLEFGADVNARDIQDDTPLHWAAFERNWDAVHLLLKHGGDREARNSSGQTPLKRAQGSGHFDWVVAHLLHPELYY